MARKKSTRKKPVLRWKFDDGDFTQPLADFEAQALNLYVGMVASDSPALRERGRRGLREAAERMAGDTVNVLQKRGAAMAPRKLDATDRDRIRAAYAQRVADGETYGALKALAARFDVSTKTIRNVLDTEN